jgi:hypothetical protein
MSQLDTSPDLAAIVTESVIIEPGSMPDEIGGPSTQTLDGLHLEYTYQTGRCYQLRFGKENVSFLLLNQLNAIERTLPYRAREIFPEVYLVHWLVPGRTGHVSLVIDFTKNIVHVAALMPGKVEFFDIAEISTTNRS